jgi:hypothetical protein
MLKSIGTVRRKGQGPSGMIYARNGIAALNFTYLNESLPDNRRGCCRFSLHIMPRDRI